MSSAGQSVVLADRLPGFPIPPFNLVFTGHQYPAHAVLDQRRLYIYAIMISARHSTIDKTGCSPGQRGDAMLTRGPHRSLVVHKDSHPGIPGEAFVRAPNLERAFDLFGPFAARAAVPGFRPETELLAASHPDRLAAGSGARPVLDDVHARNSAQIREGCQHPVGKDRSVRNSLLLRIVPQPVKTILINHQQVAGIFGCDSPRAKNVNRVRSSGYKLLAFEAVEILVGSRPDCAVEI